jgi:leucine-zipper-like transcriptional regulator 1
VRRELEVFSPLPDTDFTVEDRSLSMRGSAFPPGLRFPTGAILGTHLIIAGTYLAHTYQSFSIWALDLQTMVWSRIDPGSAVATGSWFRGCLWASTNKFLIFGNRNGNLVDDYNRRLLSWDHVAVIDLEAFGIYQPPLLELDLPMQELGLAALEEGILTDFEIICDDGRKIKCSRKILEDRWPWFKEQRLKFMEKAQLALEALPDSAMHVSLSSIPGNTSPEQERLDPRLTPRSFQLSESYHITLALLQYFYSLALITPLQHTPAVLSQLLVLSSTYRITHLQSLVKHAMHRVLSNSTSVGIYEVSTLCNCRSLQIR